MCETSSVIVPPGREHHYRDYHYAPAVRAGGLLFISGQTGALSDGSIPEGVAAQTTAAFESIGAALHAAGLTFADIVSLTSYHTGSILAEDEGSEIWEFVAVKDQYVPAPYPTWTAVGVAGLAHAGARIEVEAIASFG